MLRKRYIFLSLSLGLIALVALLTILHPAKATSAAPARPADSRPASDTDQAISAALAYIQSQQGADGGIAGFGSGSDTDSTARAVLALVASGRPVSWMTSISDTTMLDYLAANAVTYTHDTTGTLFPSRAGLLLAAAMAADQDPSAFGGMDLVSELEASFDPATGAYSTTARQGWSSGAASDLSQAWAIFGLSAAGGAVPLSATLYLRDTQAPDGSWGFGDPDTTALAVVALLGSGQVMPTDPMLQEALGYFRAAQLANGGWRPSWDSDPLNADSTGWIIQALRVAGYDPVAPAWANVDGEPISALLSLQNPDGSIGGTYVNAYSTIEALFGLTGQPLFNLGGQPRALRALSWMNEGQNPDGSWPTLFGHPAGATADAVLAYSAAGYDPHTVMASGAVTSAMDYLAANAADYAAIGPDTAGKLALAALAAGDDPRDFGGLDIAHVLTATHYSPTLGAFGIVTNTWHQALAILGLAATGESVPLSATQTLLELQQPDGGWKYDLGPWSWASAADSTGLALQALVAAGVSPTSTQALSATTFLHSVQDAQGGWEEANSSAYAIQGLLALGEDLRSPAWLQDGHSPFEALAAYQKADGPFVYDFDSPYGTPVDNIIATRQAVPALMGVFYPFSPANLVPFSPVLRGADPDRTLALAPRPVWGGAVHLTVPFAGDLDQDGILTLDWRPLGETGWISGTTLHRADGYYTATIPLTPLINYEFRALFEDPDGVQSGATLTNSLALTGTLRWYHLPFLSK